MQRFPDIKQVHTTRNVGVQLFHARKRVFFNNSVLSALVPPLHLCTIHTETFMSQLKQVRYYSAPEKNDNIKE